MFQNNSSNFYAFLPMILACDDKYQNLSARGCYLYSLMLSRQNLSERNKDRFSDENGTFIYFPIEEVGKYLNCSKPTAIASMQELISLELVTRGECAKGKSPKYYVKRLEKNNKPTPKTEEKDVSFDIEKAQRRANEGTLDFGNMKVRRHREPKPAPQKEPSFDDELAKEQARDNLNDFWVKKKRPVNTTTTAHR